ncbi:hypothetical protein OAZ06_00115 [Synechococcus sp. AH-736-G20]|nr:hypothetical protein [Synechococcus sp. AH-736-G20]
MSKLSSKPDLVSFNESPILVIPTLLSRNTLPATLDSVMPCMDLFHRVFISLNGPRSESYSPSLDTFSRVYQDRCILLRTGKELTALDHVAFIARNTERLLHPQQSLMILCDDDLLGPRENLKEYFDFLKFNNGSVVGMGNFATFQNYPKSFDKPIQNLGAEESIRPTEFVARTRLKAHFSNLSTMTMSAKIFQDSIFFMSRFGSSGFFIEYIFAAHRSASSLYSPRSVTAYIRQHSNSESLTLAYVSFVHDEIIYFLWVWLNQPLARPFTPGYLKYGLSFYRFRGIVFERFYLFLKFNFPWLLGLYVWLKNRLT